MLKSYEAIYDNGRIQWLKEEPETKNVRVIITILEDADQPPRKRRTPPPSIAGKGQTLGDIVSPMVEEEDWECLK